MWSALDRPDADPEEVFDIQSISDDSDTPNKQPSDMPARTKPKAAPARGSKADSRSSTHTTKQKRQQPSSTQEIIEISTDGSVEQQDEGHDDMDMSDFEDVDVAG